MICVIGGGPAGCMAAFAAAKQGASVRLFEQNEKLGKKWYITGKGRCNLTNDQPMDIHLQHVRRNPKFLWSAYAHYTKDDIQDFFTKRHVPVKTERGERVFPESDKSSDTIAAFEKALQKAGVTVSLHTKVESVSPAEDGFFLRTKEGNVHARAVIIATGGLSYASTGATGDGYTWAKEAGHTVTPLYPSLVGLNLEPAFPDLSGLSLRNVELTASCGKKKMSRFGELLFTNYGISGPIVLQLSAERPVPPSEFSLSLNLKPALQPHRLDARLQREAQKMQGKQMKTLLLGLLPSSLVPHVLKQAGVDETKKAAVLTAKERRRLVETMQGFRLIPGSFRGFNEAVITRGGVSVREIESGSMMSKKMPGMFFAGEVLDVDADTGGYNLQIAWSTASLAGSAAAKFVQAGGAE